MKFDIFSTDFYQVFLHGLHSSLGGKVPDPSFGRRELPHHPDEERLRETGLYSWTEGLVSVDPASRRRVYLQSWGRRECPPRAEVIMVHGIAAHGGCLAKLVPGYTSAGLRVHLMDLPGHGRSDGVHADAASMTRLVQALRGVVQHVTQTHGGPIFLMGYSLGGLVAIRYCLEHSTGVAGLSLVSPCVKLHPAVLRGPPLITLARLLAFLTPRLALPDPPQRRRGRVDTTTTTTSLAYRKSARVGTLVMILRTTAQLPTQLSPLQIPFLVQQGGKDSMLDPNGADLLYQLTGSIDKLVRIYPHQDHDMFNNSQVQLDSLDWISSQIERQLPY